jgi:KDO2-lipid IV(A) lauroyltransferase
VKKIRQALETLLVHFATRLLPRLSRRAILLLSNAVGAVACFFDARGRETAHENLRVAFAREGITPGQISRITLGSYQTFARTFFDLFWSLRLTKENYTEYIKATFADPASEAVAREKGAIWVTPHFGNFELVSLAMGFRGFAWTVVAQDFKNPALTTIFKRLREGSGHAIIPQEGAMLRLVKELKRKGHAALLTDLTIRPNKTAAVIDCFGLKTCVTTLHASLSRRLELPIIAGVCIPMPDGTYEVEAEPHFEPEKFTSNAALTQAVWDKFEQQIRKHPEAWMWMYKHWRYLPGLERDSRYPAYANPHKPFREMLAAVDEW